MGVVTVGFGTPSRAFWRILAHLGRCYAEDKLYPCYLCDLATHIRASSAHINRIFFAMHSFFLHSLHSLHSLHFHFIQDIKDPIGSKQSPSLQS